VGHAAHFYMHVVPAQALLALQPPARRSSLRDRPGHLGCALVLKRHGNLPSAFPPFMPNSLRQEIGIGSFSALVSCLPACERPSRAHRQVPSSSTVPIIIEDKSLDRCLPWRGSLTAKRADVVKVRKVAKVYSRALPPHQSSCLHFRSHASAYAIPPGWPGVHHLKALALSNVYFPRRSHG
jgi:hypothetical protein